MAYTSPFVLTTVEGKFGGGTNPEIWRCTWKIPTVGGDVPNAAKLLEYLTAIKSTVQTFHVAGVVAAGSETLLVSLAAAVIGTDGKYLGGGSQETVRYNYTSPVGGTSTAIHPNDAAMCISMKTTIARGRGSHGRFYWPATAVSLNPPNGTLPIASQTNYISLAKNLIDGINGAAVAAFGSGAFVSVMSPLGAGTTAYVKTVSVGVKMDHMSSRMGGVSEGHVWTDIVSTRQAADQALEAVHQKMIDEASTLA